MDENTWEWSASGSATGSWSGDQLTIIHEHRGNHLAWAKIRLVGGFSAGDGVADVVVESTAERLVVEIDPQQTFAELGALTIRGLFSEIAVVAPIWTGDPTELGTAEVGSLEVSMASKLSIGGDEFTVGRLTHSVMFGAPTASEYERDDAWDRLVILPDSRVWISSPCNPAVSLGDRSYLSIAGNNSVYLGSVGTDCELECIGGAIQIEDWKVHLCPSDARVHFKGVRPFGYKLLRQVRRRIRQAGPDLLATYDPIGADRAPFQLTTSKVERSDWIRYHEQLVEQYSTDPAAAADARWLSYEDRRLGSMPGSALWLLSTFALRPLGYGLKVKPPAIAWLASVALIVAIYCSSSGLRPDLSSADAWRTGLVLWVEALMLPASWLSLAPTASNSVLQIDGTTMRLARIAVSIPFAALLLALQARLRLPKLSDAKP